MNPDRLSPCILDYVVVVLLSAATLAFEILLLRYFSLTQWHHFASFAVAIALLGFGAAGTVLTLTGSKISIWGDRLFCWGGCVAGLSMAGILLLNQYLQVRPFFIIWDITELARLLALDFAAFIPFFAAALAIGHIFVRWPSAAPRLYG